MLKPRPRLGTTAAQPLENQTNRRVGTIDPNPAPPESLGHRHRRATAAIGIEHQIAGVAARPNDPLEQSLGLLGRIAESLARGAPDHINIPVILHANQSIPAQLILELLDPLETIGFELAIIGLLGTMIKPIVF